MTIYPLYSTMQTRSQSKAQHVQKKSASSTTCTRPTSPVTRSQTSGTFKNKSTFSGITTRSGLVLSG